MLQSMRSQRVRHDLATKQHQPVKANLGTGLVNKDSRHGPTWRTGRGCFCMFATSAIFWVVLDVRTCRVGDSDFFFFFFLPHCKACGILVPRPGIEPTSLALEAQS